MHTKLGRLHVQEKHAICTVSNLSPKVFLLFRCRIPPKNSRPSAVSCQLNWMIDPLGLKPAIEKARISTSKDLLLLFGRVFWRPCWNVAACQTNVKRWRKIKHRWLSTLFSPRLPQRKREFVHVSQTVKGRQIGSRILIVLEAINMEKMLLMKSWKTRKDVWIENMAYRSWNLQVTRADLLRAKILKCVFQVGRSFLCLIVFHEFRKNKQIHLLQKGNFRHKEIVCGYFLSLLDQLRIWNCRVDRRCLCSNFANDVFCFERLGDLISQNSQRLRLLRTEKLSFGTTLRETPVIVTDLWKTCEIFVKIRITVSLYWSSRVKRKLYWLAY